MGYALWKKAILLLKLANVPFDLLIAVHTVRENEYYTFGCLWCKMAFFQMGVEEGKSAAMPFFY